MKILGGMMVLFCTTWFGYVTSNKYTKRETELKQLIFSFHMMDAEIYYHQTVLQQAFLVISEKTKYPINQFYRSLADELNESVPNIAHIWERHVEELTYISGLHEEELAILIQFGMTIGDYPLHKQHEQIIITTKYLEKIIEGAMIERQKYGKLFYRFGIFFGIFIILLFL